jgi:hypothetical protein
MLKKYVEYAVQGPYAIPEGFVELHECPLFAEPSTNRLKGQSHKNASPI